MPLTVSDRWVSITAVLLSILLWIVGTLLIFHYVGGMFAHGATASPSDETIRAWESRTNVLLAFTLVTLIGATFCAGYGFKAHRGLAVSALVIECGFFAAVATARWWLR